MWGLFAALVLVCSSGCLPHKSQRISFSTQRQAMRAGKVMSPPQGAAHKCRKPSSIYRRKRQAQTSKKQTKPASHSPTKRKARKAKSPKRLMLALASTGPYRSWFVPAPSSWFVPTPWESKPKPRKVKKSKPYPAIALPTHKSFPYIKRRFGSYSWGFTKTILSRRGLFRPMIQKHIKQLRLPKGLFLVAGIESSFTPRLVSSTGAMGMWQFVKRTGKEMGLKRTPWVDERRNIEKSTRAALLYLKKLHQMFGKWEVAIAAYNCGPGCLKRVLRRCKGRSLWTIRLWRGCGLSREAAEYVARFYGLLYHWRHAPRGKKGWKVLTDMPPIRLVTVHTRGTISLYALSKATKVPLRDLYEYNPELVSWLTPPGENYPLKVLPEAAKRVKRYLRRSKKRRIRWKAFSYKKGMSLDAIGYRFRVPSFVLRYVNRLWGKWPLRKRKVLLIPLPPRGKRWPKNRRASKLLGALVRQSKRYGWRFPAYFRYWARYRHRCYRVRKGDTLPIIAKRVYVALAKLKQFNQHIRELRPGQRINLRSYSRCQHSWRKKRKKRKKPLLRARLSN